MTNDTLAWLRSVEAVVRDLQRDRRHVYRHPEDGGGASVALHTSDETAAQHVAMGRLFGPLLDLMEAVGAEHRKHHEAVYAVSADDLRDATHAAYRAALAAAERERRRA